MKKVSLDLYEEFSEIFMIIIIKSKLIYFIKFICNFLNLINIDKFLFELLNSFNKLSNYIAIIS